MANSILKLKVESDEYDAKLKKAAEGIRHLADVAHKGAGELTGLEKAELDYIKALGDMETKSKTAAGSTRELENAFKELTVIYNNLNDVEKADEGGKALAASLETLKKRAQDAKAGLNEATQALQGNEKSANGDKIGIEALTSALGINVKSLMGWGTALTAGKVALDVAKDAFMQTEGNIDDWGRAVQVSEAAYNVFLQTLNTGNWSGFFQNLNTAINGARELYNALDRLGSVKSNNQAAIAIVQKQIADLRLMKQQGQNVDDQLKKATEKLANLQRQSVVAGKNAGRTMAAETIKNRFNAMGGNLAGSSANDIVERIMRNGQSEFDRQSNILASLTKAGTGTRDYGTYKVQGVFDINNLTKEQQKQYKLAKAITEGETEIQKGISIYAQAVSEGTANAREQFKGNRYALQGGGGGRSGGSGSSVTYQAGSLAAQQAEVQRLTKLWQESGVAVRDQYLQPLVEAERKLQQMRDEMGIQKDLAQGKLSGAGAESFLQSMRGATGLSNKFDAKSQIQLDEKAVARAMADAEKQTKRREEKEEKKYLSEGLSQLSGGLGGLQSGFAQLGIDLGDGFGAVVGGLQAITTILMAIQALVGAIETISALDAIIPFAGGGIVKAAGGTIVGRSFSGDNLRALGPGGQLYGLNAGEVVLNRSQVNNLSSALTGNVMENLHLETYLDGRAIRIVLNNESQGRLKGKYVTSRRG